MKPIEEPKEAPPPPAEEAPPTEEKEPERFVYLASESHLLVPLYLFWKQGIQDNSCNVKDWQVIEYMNIHQIYNILYTKYAYKKFCLHLSALKSKLYREVSYLPKSYKNFKG